MLVEKALDAELTEHLGHERHDSVANASGNTRNGKSKKTLKGDFGELPIKVPRDRHDSFEPQLIPKHQTRWAGFDDKIISLYACGMTVREIQSHLQDVRRRSLNQPDFIGYGRRQRGGQGLAG